MSFVRYLIVQLLAYAVDMGGFLIAIKYGFQEPVSANLLGKVGAAVFAFALHRTVTFQVGGSPDGKSQALRYSLLFVLASFLSSLILLAVQTILPFPPLAKFVSDVLCVLLTYQASKSFVFVKSRSSAFLNREEDPKGARN